MALNIVERIDDAVRIDHVLISVSDKSGLEQLVPGLTEVNPAVMIYSTGGTFKAIESILGEKAARNLTSVSAYTGQPEMQGGLVKTLDFKIYLGLLSETYNPAHGEDLTRTGSVAIDMVVANLYPFKQTVAADGVTPEMARTNIDIGGPCMVRASAKNHADVAIVVNPGQYPSILEALETDGDISPEKRRELAIEAYQMTSKYDAAIVAYLSKAGV